MSDDGLMWVTECWLAIQLDIFRFYLKPQEISAKVFIIMIGYSPVILLSSSSVQWRRSVQLLISWSAQYNDAHLLVKWQYKGRDTRWSHCTELDERYIHFGHPVSRECGPLNNISTYCNNLSEKWAKVNTIEITLL